MARSTQRCAALRSERAGACLDLHLFPVLLPLAPAGCPPPRQGYAVVAPASCGSVQLASADPQAAPLIDPGFLRDRRDLDRLEQGLRLIRQAAASRAFAGMPPAEAWPGADVRTSAGLREFIRRTVSASDRAAPGKSSRIRLIAEEVVPQCGSDPAHPVARRPAGFQHEALV
jgi:choline dehydrogenase-like flavoprotein